MRSMNVHKRKYYGTPQEQVKDPSFQRGTNTAKRFHIENYRASVKLTVELLLRRTYPVAPSRPSTIEPELR